MSEEAIPAIENRMTMNNALLTVLSLRIHFHCRTDYWMVKDIKEKPCFPARITVFRDVMRECPDTLTFLNQRLLVISPEQNCNYRKDSLVIDQQLQESRTASFG